MTLTESVGKMSIAQIAALLEAVENTLSERPEFEYMTKSATDLSADILKAENLHLLAVEESKVEFWKCYAQHRGI